MEKLFSEIKQVRTRKKRRVAKNFIPKYMMELAISHFNLSYPAIKMRLLKGKPEYVKFFAELTEIEMQNFTIRKLELKEAKKTKNKILRDLAKLKPMVD